jgi:hypothetical protein
MRVLEHTWQDKTTWGDGPWQQEPDKRQWPDTATGLPCLVLRRVDHGHWCGYVGVEPGHPLYGILYNRCALRSTPCDPEPCDHTPGMLLSVHGGLTYSGYCQDDPHGICHVPDAGEEEKLWWFGFDCAHAGDLAPGLEATLRQVYTAVPQIAERQARRAALLAELRMEDVYCTAAYVMGECAQLAQQLGATGILLAKSGLRETVG